MDASALPPRRRWILPVLGLAGAATAAGAAFFVYHERERAAQRAQAIAAFDLDAAMNLAGTEVPAGTESFYFFVLEPDASDESAELADKLVQAAGEHEFLGIAGADAAHNREVLLAALASVRGRNLAGLVLIYIGPQDQQAELQSQVAGSGAELRFVTYQPPAPETI